MPLFFLTTLRPSTHGRAFASRRSAFPRNPSRAPESQAYFQRLRLWNLLIAWCHAKHKRCSAPFKSVCPFLLHRPKEMDVIRALFHPWALGLAHIRVRSKKGAAARCLSRVFLAPALPDAADARYEALFANFLFACEAPRWRFSYRLSVRFQRTFKFFFYSFSFLYFSIPLFSMIFSYYNRRLSAPVKLLLLHVQLHYLLFILLYVYQ